MFGFGILTGLTFLPMVGVAFLLTQRGEDAATLRNIRWATLLTALAYCTTPLTTCESPTRSSVPVSRVMALPSISSLSSSSASTDSSS